MPSNQNLQIYTNPLASHLENVINQPYSSYHHIDYDEKIQEENHVVNHVELAPQPLISSQPEPKHIPLISFSQFDMFKPSNGPFYVTTRVAHIPSYGTMVDHSSFVNVIIEEHLVNKGLHRDTYDITPVWI